MIDEIKSSFARGLDASHHWHVGIGGVYKEHADMIRRWRITKGL